MNYKTKIHFLSVPTDEDWMEVKRRALITVGKTPITPPDDEWKKKMLTCRHSPIRYLRFSILFENLPSFVSVHLCRHIHAQPYVKSQRDDRNDNTVSRNQAPQDTPVSMIWDLNCEELLTVFNKRLCGQADRCTQEVIIRVREQLIKIDPIYKDFAVPMCLHMHSCPEVFKTSCNSLFKERILGEDVDGDSVELVTPKLFKYPIGIVPTNDPDDSIYEPRSGRYPWGAKVKNADSKRRNTDKLMIFLDKYSDKFKRYSDFKNVALFVKTYFERNGIHFDFYGKYEFLNHSWLLDKEINTVGDYAIGTLNDEDYFEFHNEINGLSFEKE